MKYLAAAALAFLGTTVAAQACPNYSSAGVEQYNASGDFLYQPRSYNVTAGGESNVLNCGNVQPRTDRGQGYFASQPDFSFFLSGMGPFALHISVTGTCDTTLLINTGAANWYYDDDDGDSGGGKITLSNPSNGRIDVWAGTYDSGYCDAVVTLESF